MDNFISNDLYLVWHCTSVDTVMYSVSENFFMCITLKNCIYFYMYARKTYCLFASLELRSFNS